MRTPKLAGVAVATAACLTLAACGGSSGGGSTASSGGSTPSSGSSAGAGAASSLTANAFASAGGPQATYAELAALKPLVQQGKGKVAVLLPDTQSSARYVTQDAPDFKKAFESMGMSSDQYIIENAQGSASTQQTQAEQAITNGATVLVLDGLDAGSAGAIEAGAKAKGVPVIDYDRITLNGSESYYVSFDNVRVGKLIGQGLLDCISKWGVKNPQVYEIDGSPTDNNATLFAQGYNSVLDPKYKSGELKKVGEQGVPDWDNQKALTIFQQAYQAHPNINAVAVANDGMANSVISALKNKSVQPKTIPTTGQDATLQGMQNILAGYQCMSVYKPIYQEASAAAALAAFLRAGQQPPAALVNGKTNDKKTDVPSVLLTPTSVTVDNMNDTVIKDGFVDPSKLCAGSFASACQKAGIKTS